MKTAFSCLGCESLNRTTNFKNEDGRLIQRSMAFSVHYVFTTNLVLVILTGFPCGIGNIEKVLNCEISFQDFEKVLNLAKTQISIRKI